MAKTDKNSAKSLISLWLVNLLVIYFASLFYSQDIVLGNAVLPNWIALVIVSLILTLILAQVKPVIIALKLKSTNKLTRGIISGVVNIVVLWLLARMAIYTGFGVSSVFVVLILGIVLEIVQYGVMKILPGNR